MIEPFVLDDYLKKINNLKEKAKVTSITIDDSSTALMPETNREEVDIEVALSFLKKHSVLNVGEDTSRYTYTNYTKEEPVIEFENGRCSLFFDLDNQQTLSFIFMF